MHKPAAPKDASGSAWNASNYHWEEKQLDKWGKERLSQLFHPTNKGTSWHPRKDDVRLPGEGNSRSHGARPVHLTF